MQCDGMICSHVGIGITNVYNIDKYLHKICTTLLVFYSLRIITVVILYTTRHTKLRSKVENL